MATLGVQGGAQVSGDTLDYFWRRHFATPDMRSLRLGEAAGGSAYVSAYAGAALGGSVTVSVGFSNKPFVSHPTWVSGSVGAGASIGAGATVGVSYSFPVFKKQFK